MFAIAKTSAAPGLNIISAEAPLSPQAHEVQIAVTHAGVCGTDYHIYSWDGWAQGRVKPPLILGHEFVGEVVAVGSGVTHVTKGQRVSAECHVVCSVCSFCRTGRGHLCAQTSIIGVDQHGAFAERVNVPASNIWPVHNDIPDHHAAIFDPLGNAMHTVMEVPVATKHVVILGAGPIGLMAIAMCKAFGAARVTVLEPQAAKRRLAEDLDADEVLNPLEMDVQSLKQLQPEIVLEFSGNAKAIQGGLAMLQNGGDMVMLGIPPEPVTLDIANEVVFRGLKLHGIIGRKMFETWQQSDAFMRNHPYVLERIITDRVRAQDFERALTMMKEGTGAKAVLEFN